MHKQTKLHRKKINKQTKLAEKNEQTDKQIKLERKKLNKKKVGRIRTNKQTNKGRK